MSWRAFCIGVEQPGKSFYYPDIGIGFRHGFRDDECCAQSCCHSRITTHVPTLVSCPDDISRTAK